MYVVPSQLQVHLFFLQTALKIYYSLRNKKQYTPIAKLERTKSPRVIETTLTHQFPHLRNKSDGKPSGETVSPKTLILKDPPNFCHGTFTLLSRTFGTTLHLLIQFTRQNSFSYKSYNIFYFSSDLFTQKCINYNEHKAQTRHL